MPEYYNEILTKEGLQIAIDKIINIDDDAKSIIYSNNELDRLILEETKLNIEKN